MNIDNISLTLFVGPQAHKYSVSIALEHNSTKTSNPTIVTLKASSASELKGGCTVFERSTSLNTLSETGAQWKIEDLERVIGTLSSSEFSDVNSALLMVAHQRFVKA